MVHFGNVDRPARCQNITPGPQRRVRAEAKNTGGAVCGPVKGLAREAALQRWSLTIRFSELSLVGILLHRVYMGPLDIHEQPQPYTHRLQCVKCFVRRFNAPADDVPQIRYRPLQQEQKA